MYTAKKNYNSKQKMEYLFRRTELMCFIKISEEVKGK
jgi:hypothetical protein